jgi:hypothetical protein
MTSLPFVLYACCDHCFPPGATPTHEQDTHEDPCPMGCPAVTIRLGSS